MLTKFTLKCHKMFFFGLNHASKGQKSHQMMGDKMKEFYLSTYPSKCFKQHSSVVVVLPLAVMLGWLPKKRTHKTSSNKVKIVNNNYKRLVWFVSLCKRDQFVVIF